MKKEKNIDFDTLYENKYRYGETYTSMIERLKKSNPKKVLYISPEPWREFSEFEKTLEKILLNQNYNILPDKEVDGWLQAKKENACIEYSVGDKPFPVKNDSPGVSFCIKAKILLPQIERKEYVELIESLVPYGVDQEYLLHYEDVHDRPFPF